MRAAAELPDELAGPVGYSSVWLTLAVVGLGLVALYYLGAWLLTRPRTARAAPTVRAVAVPDARREHLRRIDLVEAEVGDGRLEPRVGHQQLSEVVRSYVEVVGPLPARSMALADLRAQAPGHLADAIALMYPPGFAPDGEARERFDHAVIAARGLVRSWS